MRRWRVIVGNAGCGLVVSSNLDTVNTEDDWWGCAAGPTDATWGSVTGDTGYDPWVTGPVIEAGVG